MADETKEPTAIEHLQANVQAEIARIGDDKLKAAAESEEGPEAVITTEADAATETEGESPPTPQPETEKDAEGERPEPSTDIDPVLLAAAKRAKRSDDEIATILELDPATARMVLSGFKEIEDNYSRELSRGGQAELEKRKKGQEAATTKAAVPSDAPESAPPAEKQATTLADYGVDEELIDPALTAPLQKLIEDMGALRTENATVMQFIERQRKAQEDAQNVGNEQQAMELIDSFLEPLCRHEVYADAYGNGKTSDLLKSKTAHGKARLELLTKADEIYIGATQMGRDITAEEALERAVSILWRDELPTKATEKAREKVASQLNGRARQFTPKPTNRRGEAAVDQMQKARQVAREGSQKIGIL